MTALYVHEAGDPAGKPILFLHGGGLSGRMWQPQMDALSEFHCLAPDLPEHGRSAAVAPFTLRGAAEAVVALIRDRIAGQRAHMVGLSIGAAVGLEILCVAPQCVDKALLSGPTPSFGKGLAALVDAINGPMLRLLPRQRLIAMTMKSLHVPAQYNDLVNDDLQQLTPDLYRHINRATGEVRLPQKPVPDTFIVVGQREPAMSRRHAARIGETVPGVVACLVQGVGHAWNLEAPALFNDTVRAWLTGGPLPAQLQPLPGR
ncbi:MAG: alpha/beta hydrolase [Anaerolineae bacterium]|jgi:pimeloyl-ACP methyl ester carboxylesterase